MPGCSSLNQKENRFGFEPNVTAKISRIKSKRVYEVGISYFRGTYLEGKKNNWKDGFKAIYCIINMVFLGVYFSPAKGKIILKPFESNF